MESVTVSPAPVASAPAVCESPLPNSEVIEPDMNSEGSVPSPNNLEPSPPLLRHEDKDVNDDNQVPQATSTIGSVIDIHLGVEDITQSNNTVAPTEQTQPMKHPAGSEIPAKPQRGL